MPTLTADPTINDAKEKMVLRWRTNRALFISQVLLMPIKTFQGRMVLHKGQIHENKRIQVKLLPRDSGKSWSGTIGDSIYEMSIDPDITMCYIAESQSTAKLFLTQTKAICEQSTKLKKYFGNHASRENWSKTEITSALRRRISKEPTISTHGAGGAIVGRHVDKVYCDDVSTLRTAATEAKRDALWSWLHTVVLPIINPGGILSVAGTRYFPGDMYEAMVDLWGDGILFRVPALMWCEFYDWSVNHTWEHGADTTGDACEVLYDEKGQVIPGTVVYHSFFYERYNVGTLLEMRRSDPASFESQRQNAIRLQGSGVILADKIKIISYKDMPPLENLQLYAASDLASGMKKEHDFFSNTIIAYNPMTAFIYVIHSDILRLPDTFYMMDTIYKLWRRFYETGAAWVNWGLEAGNFQRVLGKNFTSDHPDKVKKYSAVPVSPINTITDKEARFYAQTGRINSGSVFFLDSCMPLVDDIIAFPNIPKKDRVDSFILCLESLFGITREFKGLPFNIMELAQQGSRIISF